MSSLHIPHPVSLINLPIVNFCLIKQTPASILTPLYYIQRLPSLKLSLQKNMFHSHSHTSFISHKTNLKLHVNCPPVQTYVSWHKHLLPSHVMACADIVFSSSQQLTKVTVHRKLCLHYFDLCCIWVPRLFSLIYLLLNKVLFF